MPLLEEIPEKFDSVSKGMHLKWSHVNHGKQEFKLIIFFFFLVHCINWANDNFSTLFAFKTRVFIRTCLFIKIQLLHSLVNACLICILIYLLLLQRQN